MKLLERFAWLSLLTACLVVLLSLAASDQPIDSSVALFWWRWLLLLAVGLGLGVSLVGWLGERLSGKSIGGFLLWVAGVTILTITVVANGASSLRLLRLGDDPAAAASATLAFVLTLVAICLTIAWDKGNGWWYRVASLLALGAFAFWIWPPQPSPASEGSSLPPVQLSQERLLVIGLDGADWAYIDPMMDRGELPNLQRLVDTGVRAPLATLRPTRSPALWTTMVTGKDPVDHGIEGHAVVHAKGGRHAMPKPESMARGFGLGRLYDRLRQRGHIVSSPATSLERQVPAYWNITTAYDSPLDVINWWATWPAEPILGRMVTDRTYFWRWAARGFEAVDEAITFPDSLYRQLAPLVMRPDEVSLADARQFMDIEATAFSMVDA